MKIKAILFDLDGTLLPMDQDKFIENYFKDLAEYMCKDGAYEPSQYTKAVWQGVKAMLLNNNEMSNEERYFWELGNIFGEESAKKAYPVYREFYATKYLEGKAFCSYTPRSKELIGYLKERNIRIALATNPVFPDIATNARMSWVDLKPEDFEIVTTCDNVGYSKPNPKYYLDIASKMGIDPCECLVVGNDVEDDMVAMDVGMDVFLLTDCLLNKRNKDISIYPNGNFDDLIKYINSKI